MPSIGQIVPQYLHPHVSTYINDNTLITDAVVTPIAPVRTLAVFASSKGRDNKFVEVTSLSQYLAEFGEPNFALYGQPGMMPYAFLSQPNSSVYCMRVTPDDAAYSNVLMVAKVKVNATDPDNKVLDVKFQAQYFPGVTVDAEFVPLVNAVLNEEPDDDGYFTYPVALFKALGRGVYGDQFRVRISSHTDADKDNEYKNYRIEVFTTDNGLQRVEMFAVSLFEGAVQGANRTSYFLEDVINEQSSRLGCYVYKNTLEKIYDLYKAEVNPTTTYTLKTFDFISGMNKATATFDTSINVDKLSIDASNFDRIEGIVFGGGSDGAFAVGADPIAREQILNQKYLNAFRGEIDRKILSKRRMPCDVIFDANYEELVKKALINLIIQRYDAYGYIDGGILNTVSDAVDFAEYYEDYGDRIFSKECQHFKMRDPFSGKVITLTTTYFIASNIVNHFKTVGNNIPFVGESNATLTGHIKDSLLPIVDADDAAVKEQLYLKRVNFFHAIGDNLYVRATQTTSQFSSDASKWSDLSEENNMHVLLQMKRISEDYVARITYNFASAEERRVFIEDLTRLLEVVSGKVTSYEVTFSMNEWETERSILHCYISVVFKTLAKRGIIEIDINKRT